MKYLPLLTTLLVCSLTRPPLVHGNENPAPPRQGAELLKTDILAVFAHPDDETGVSATLAAYALVEHKSVTTVYCTRGEGGGNMVGTQWGESLGILREAELRRCLAQIGVRDCYFLDQQDFFYTESVAATFAKWNKERTLERLVRLFRSLRPDVVITMNPAPTPGQHGHHQAAGILATEAFDAAADPSRFPDQLKREGLAAWQASKLYFSGGASAKAATVVIDRALPDGTNPGQIAGRAAAEHRSQAFGNFADSPWMRRPQRFSLAKSVVPFEDAEDSLFRGLPTDSTSRKRVEAPRDSTPQLPVRLNFVPRPAIAAYQKWAEQENVEHLSSGLTADLSVVAGGWNDVLIEVANSGREPISGTLQLNAENEWRVDPASLQCSVTPGMKKTLHCRVSPPAAASADSKLSASSQIGDQVAKAVTALHPVPLAKAARLASAPALDCTDAGWPDGPALEISPNRLVQGSVKSGADSSARFRIAYDRTTLFVDVDVDDDVIVSNIAPNDIRGHWRSDSVEICIDPAAGAEHTLGCFKVGIIPFDTSGVVRAARDADANQGPIEETAPTMRLSSERSAKGYRIQAAIPFREIGVDSLEGRRIGFNLIIYDGDKADAAGGENINKSRIAWSPRAGVQGRPEDWGRIDF